MNNANTSAYSQTNSTWSSTLDPTHSKTKKQSNSYRASRPSSTGLPSPPRRRQREQRLQVRRLEVAILGGVSAPPVFHRPFLPRRGRADHRPRGPALARVRRHATVRHCLHRTAAVVGHTILPFSGRAYGLHLLWRGLESNQIYGGFGGGWGPLLHAVTAGRQIEGDCGPRFEFVPAWRMTWTAESELAAKRLGVGGKEARRVFLSGRKWAFLPTSCCGRRPKPLFGFEAHGLNVDVRMFNSGSSDWGRGS